MISEQLYFLSYYLSLLPLSSLLTGSPQEVQISLESLWGYTGSIAFLLFSGNIMTFYRPIYILAKKEKKSN